MRSIAYLIEPRYDGWRVDSYLRREQGVSGRVLTQLRKQPDGLLRNGAHIRTVDLLQSGDTLTLNLPDEIKRMPPCDRKVEILYEDADIIIYNKPADMPVHQSGGHIHGTLSGVYAAHCAAFGAVTPFRAVNRLDKDTTGAVVAAKHQLAACKLWKGVRKRYIAVVRDIPFLREGIIDLPIDREVPYELKRVVDPDGQPAATGYRVLAEGADCALAEFRLYTGRTHQIRVHMAHLGHPLLGDALYGGADGDIARQALHCAEIHLIHPVSGETLRVWAPPPDDFAALLAARGLPPECCAPSEEFWEAYRFPDYHTEEQLR